MYLIVCRRNIPGIPIIIIFIVMMSFLSSCSSESDKPELKTKNETAAPTLESVATVMPNNQSSGSEGGDGLEAELNKEQIDRTNAGSLSYVAEISLTDANSFVWLQEGEIVAAASDNQVSLYDMISLSNVTYGSWESTNPALLASSEAGTSMVWVDNSNSVYLYSTENNKPPGSIVESPAQITGLALTNDEVYLAIATTDGIIEIIRTVDHEPVSSWQFDKWFSSLNFSPDGNFIAAVDKNDFSLFIIDVSTGDINQILEWTESVTPSLTGVFMSPDWKSAAWVSAEVVQLMSVQDGELGPLLIHEDAVTSIGWSPNSDLIASSSVMSGGDEFIPVILLWDVETGILLNQLAQDEVTLDVGFSPNKYELGVLSSNQNIYLWGVEENHQK